MDDEERHDEDEELEEDEELGAEWEGAIGVVESSMDDDGKPSRLVELLGSPPVAGLLPLRGSVLFPRTVVPVRVGRPKGVALVQAMVTGPRLVVAVKQKDAATDDPGRVDLEDVGCVASIVRTARLADGTLNVLLHGLRRVQLAPFSEPGDPLRCRIEVIEESETPGPEARALLLTARAQVARLRALVPELPTPVLDIASRLPTPGALADILASIIDLRPEEAQALLAQPDGNARLRTLIARVEHELHVLSLGKEIREQAQKAITEAQTEVILREQLEAIQRRLGEGEEPLREMQQLRARLDEAGLPPEARREVDRELGRLARISSQSPEHSVVRTYLEWMSELPWSHASADRLDLAHARRVLDEDHHGLDDVKERILDFLAVRSFRPEAPSPILCLIGPPGTGKTSLGRSIARALERKYVRVSLGGVHDEAEIRGHRRTYVGAMPGRVIAMLRRAGTRNPVMVLDEIDKVGRDVRGDPYAALLEVLDPEQNVSFVDHYIATPFDLSQVMFVCTANVLEAIPGPLRDRMEVVHLPGYTPQEKVAIARRHIVPRKLEALGLADRNLTFGDDALDLIIAGYTREAGVRELERQIVTVLRKTARRIASGETPPSRIDATRVRELLGKPRFLEPELPPLDRPGTALGLAWTPVGGEVLVIEAVAQPGKEGLVLTGQLGDVMKESATAALSYLRAHADELGIDRRISSSRIHLHVPAGAIPKDGPSAGVAMFVALASLCTGRLPREGVAMTGEITLRGRVLPVGGVREKVIGAHRAGIRTVILPRRNEADLEEVPADVRADVGFILVDDAAEAATVALRPSLAERSRATG